MNCLTSKRQKCEDLPNGIYRPILHDDRTGPLKKCTAETIPIFRGDNITKSQDIDPNNNIISQNLANTKHCCIFSCIANEGIDEEYRNSNRQPQSSFYCLPPSNGTDYGTVIEVDPEDTPPLLHNERIVALYKDSKCITEHISKEAIKGTLVVTNYKIHFLSNTQESKKDESPTMINVRSAILNMPLGFVNKVEAIGDEWDPFKIKVDCKDMRSFVFLLGDPIQKNTKGILQKISELKISNPSLTAMTNWMSKSIFQQKGLKDVKNCDKPPVSLKQQPPEPDFRKELNKKLDKSLNSLMIDAGIEGSFTPWLPDALNAKPNSLDNTLVDLQLLKLGIQYKKQDT